MQNNKYNQLKEVIVKTVPDIRVNCSSEGGGGKQRWTSERYITLEDLMRVFAHFSMPDVEFTISGTPKMCSVSIEVYKYKTGNKKKITTWKAGLPLHKQSTETIDFLHSLLVK